MGAFSMLREALAAGKEALFLTVVDSSDGGLRAGEKFIAVGGELVYGPSQGPGAQALMKLLIVNGETTTGLETAELEKGGKALCFLQRFNPPPRLIILGGGHVGAALSAMAALLDYRIVIIDDRPSFASREKHPYAHRLICSDFEAALDGLPATGSDYLVIVTRGHRHDRLCLEKALARPAAYIGMIGSRKRVRGLMEELAGSGFEQKDLDRVHSPIGLKIGAVTEGEIAVSILAEITAVRRAGGGQETVQEAVLKELAELEREGGRAALATIIRAYGSTPRKAGARMIVYPDGQISGTIGGGCAEAEVRLEALQLAGKQPPRIYPLDLTAQAAAEEGMVCGGRMEIFIEPLG